MKQTLLLSIFLFFAFVGFAQSSFSFENDTIIIENITTTDEIVVHNPFTNSMSADADFHWERIIVNMPETPWSSLICEHVCYGPGVSEATFSLDAGATSIFDFHIYPANLDEVSEVEVHIKMSNAADTSQSVTAVYIFRTGTVGTDDVIISKTPILLYPNPTFDYINIKNGDDVSKLVVYNIMGRVIKTFYTDGMRSFDVSELAEGMYLVGLFDKNNNIIKTTRVSKRTLMP